MYPLQQCTDVTRHQFSPIKPSGCGLTLCKNNSYQRNETIVYNVNKKDSMTYKHGKLGE